MSDERHVLDGELADTVAMLEQILEVMPQDIMALKGLYNAYRQGGVSDQSFKYLNLLADVAADGGGAELAEFVIGKLQEFQTEFPGEVTAQISRIRSMSSSTPGGVGGGTGNSPSSAETEVDEELALAWKLYEEKQLSQEEYSAVLHDLTESSSRDLNVPVSVLHVLHDQGFNRMTRLVNYMSSRSGMPTVSLLNFTLPEQSPEAFPLAISEHKGALPFGFVGDDILLAVLNPFNHQLVETVVQMSGQRCHAYLVMPDEYDLVLGKLREMAS